MSGVRWRLVAPWLVIIVLLVVVASLAGGPDRQGHHLDPDGVGPTGLKALRELLTSFDARVRVGYDPTPDADVMLVTQDVVADDDLDAVEQWVSDGGILVLTDPWSALSPVSVVSGRFFESGGGAIVTAQRCDIPALGELGSITPGPYRLEVGDGDRSCFGDGVEAHVVEKSIGAGAIVVVSGSNTFVNEHLGETDNAALAVSLLAPVPGTRVLMLEAGSGSSDRSLSASIPTGVRRAIVQLLAAFVFYAWFRGRRLGKPVVEHQPVQIEGSELVLAVGGLVRRTRDPDAAAGVLRADIRRRLTSRLGLAPHADPRVIVEVAATRTGIDPGRLIAAVGDGPVSDDAQLLELACNIDSIRKEILDGPV